MKITYKNMNVRDLKNSLKSLLPNAHEFKVEFSLFEDAPGIVHDEVMSLEHIIELVEKQGFKVNDICGVGSGGVMKDCVGITFKKPYIDENIKDSIESIFVLGNIMQEQTYK